MVMKNLMVMVMVMIMFMVTENVKVYVNADVKVLFYICIFYVNGCDSVVFYDFQQF